MGTLTGRRPAGRERGFVLLMTLIILIVMTLSGLAMMLVMRAGVSTAGNIAFRQAAVRVADVAVESARTYILARSAVSLQSDDPANGYYASQQPAFTPLGYDFTAAAGVSRDAGTVSGYSVRYVIHRMAMTAGVACSDPTAGCMFPPAASSAGTTAGTSHAGGSSYAGAISGTTGLVFYRITVKVSGPRYNNRYVQAFLY